MKFQIFSLSEICDLNAPITYGILQPGPDVPGGVPYVRPSEIKDGEIEVSSIRRTSPAIADRYKKSSIKAGDILITIVGTIGHIAVVPDSLTGGNITQSSARIRVSSPKADREYIKNFLRSDLAKRQYDEHRLGVAVPRLNLHHVRDLEIPLPPLAEQKRIAGILDAADALRAKRRAALAQLDALAQSLFLDLFGDPVTNPKGWEDSSVLDSHADIVSGITKGRKLGDKPVREVPYLAVANVQDKYLKLDAVKSIPATEDEIRRYRILRNDLLLTEGGDPDKLGRGSLWTANLPDCIHQNHVFRVRITSSHVDPVYLNWIVGSRRGKDYFLRSAKQTTGIASINMKQLKAFPMLLPPLPIQQQFAAAVEAIERQKVLHREHLAGLDALFASLQHRAFRGEL
jgi:type I restriction enzyme, S subunit